MERLLQISKSFYLDKTTQEFALADDSMLVYGGDAGDKGIHTLRVYAKLVQLKKVYPDRVILLAGNRDINKMRLISELVDNREMNLNYMAKEILEGPIWVPADKRLSLRSYLERQSKIHHSEQGLDASQWTPKDLEGVNTKVNRLKWMLNYTMGSQGDFDRRRQELAEMNEKAPHLISDEQVLQSYLESVSPNGIIRQYLSLAQLAFICKESLFVHGGIVNGENNNNNSFSALEFTPQGLKTFSSIHAWAQALNDWNRAQITDWVVCPFWSEDHGTRGGNHLMTYALPDYHPISVVMGRHLNASGMPVQLPYSVAKKLADNGIKRLIVGHTPHGNCPTVIPQTDDTSFQHVIMADTSYSDMKAEDNRGAAASEIVVVDVTTHHGTIVNVHGVLENERCIRYTLVESSLVGRALKDRSMIKAKIESESAPEYLSFSVKNRFDFHYAVKSGKDVEEELT
ncbi:hypothetical protein ABG067_001367 [Albugo candida]